MSSPMPVKTLAISLPTFLAKVTMLSIVLTVVFFETLTLVSKRLADVKELTLSNQYIPMDRMKV